MYENGNLVWCWNLRDINVAYNCWGDLIEEIGTDLYYAILDLG